MALFAIGCLPFIIEYTLSDRKSLSVLMTFLEQLKHFFPAAAIVVVKLFIGRKPKGIILTNKVVVVAVVVLQHKFFLVTSSF